jgi:hypothetical protein
MANDMESSALSTTAKPNIYLRKLESMRHLMANGRMTIEIGTTAGHRALERSRRVEYSKFAGQYHGVDVRKLWRRL